MAKPIVAVQPVNGADDVRFSGNQLQPAGASAFSVHRNGLYRFRCVAGGRGTAQPAAGFGQLVHIVPDALGNGLPLQLAEYRCNVHHGPAHGA